MVINGIEYAVDYGTHAISWNPQFVYLNTSGGGLVPYDRGAIVDIRDASFSLSGNKDDIEDADAYLNKFGSFIAPADFLSFVEDGQTVYQEIFGAEVDHSQITGEKIIITNVGGSTPDGNTGEYKLGVSFTLRNPVLKVGAGDIGCRMPTSLAPMNERQRDVFNNIAESTDGFIGSNAKGVAELVISMTDQEAEDFKLFFVKTTRADSFDLPDSWLTLPIFSGFYSPEARLLNMRESISDFDQRTINFSLRSARNPVQPPNPDLDVLVKIFLNRKDNELPFTDESRGIVDDVMYLTSTTTNVFIAPDNYFSQLMSEVPYSGSQRVASHIKGQVTDTYRRCKLNIIDAGLTAILTAQNLELKGAVVDLRRKDSGLNYLQQVYVDGRVDDNQIITLDCASIMDKFDKRIDENLVLGEIGDISIGDDYTAVEEGLILRKDFDEPFNRYVYGYSALTFLAEPNYPTNKIFIEVFVDDENDLADKINEGAIFEVVKGSNSGFIAAITKAESNGGFFTVTLDRDIDDLNDEDGADVPEYEASMIRISNDRVYGLIGDSAVTDYSFINYDHLVTKVGNYFLFDKYVNVIGEKASLLYKLKKFTKITVDDVIGFSNGDITVQPFVGDFTEILSEIVDTPSIPLVNHAIAGCYSNVNIPQSFDIQVHLTCEYPFDEDGYDGIKSDDLNLYYSAAIRRLGSDGAIDFDARFASFTLQSGIPVREYKSFIEDSRNVAARKYYENTYILPTDKYQRIDVAGDGNYYSFFSYEYKPILVPYAYNPLTSLGDGNPSIVEKEDFKIKIDGVFSNEFKVTLTFPIELAGLQDQDNFLIYLHNFFNSSIAKTFDFADVVVRINETENPNGHRINYLSRHLRYLLADKQGYDAALFDSTLDEDSTLGPQVSYKIGKSENKTYMGLIDDILQQSYYALYQQNNGIFTLIDERELYIGTSTAIDIDEFLTNQVVTITETDMADLENDFSEIQYGYDWVNDKYQYTVSFINYNRVGGFDIDECVDTNDLNSLNDAGIVNTMQAIWEDLSYSQAIYGTVNKISSTRNKIQYIYGGLVGGYHEVYASLKHWSRKYPFRHKIITLQMSRKNYTGSVSRGSFVSYTDTLKTAGEVYRGVLSGDNHNGQSGMVELEIYCDTKDYPLALGIEEMSMAQGLVEEESEADGVIDEE